MKISKISFYVEVALASLLVGAAFNSVVALTSILFPYITLATATLTGFGIITLVKQFLRRNRA
jgi:hypothetical protein